MALQARSTLIEDDVVTIETAVGAIQAVNASQTTTFNSHGVRITELEGELSGGVQYNDPFPTPTTSPWGASFASFIDFSDSENEVIDVTGLNRNATIVGGK